VISIDLSKFCEHWKQENEDISVFVEDTYAELVRISQMKNLLDDDQICWCCWLVLCPALAGHITSFQRLSQKWRFWLGKKQNMVCIKMYLFAEGNHEFRRVRGISPPPQEFVWCSLMLLGAFEGSSRQVSHTLILNSK